MIGLKYFFVYDKLYQSVLNASFEDDDGASLGEDPTGVVPYFYPTYTPTETKVFLTGQLAGLLQVAEAIGGQCVRRLSLTNDEVLVWHFPRCLLVMSYEGQLPVEALENHFSPLVEAAAYFYLCQTVNNPPAPPVPTKTDTDLGYYDLPTSSTEDEPDRRCEVLIPEIYSDSSANEDEEVKEETEAFECVEPMKLTNGEKAALEGFVFLLANLLQNLCSTLRPEMTLLNLSKHGNDVFVESQELLAEIRRDFGANGGAIFFHKQLVTSTLGVEVTKLVALVDLNAGVPAEVVIPVENSAGSRLGVYRVWVREETNVFRELESRPRRQSSVESSPEKLSASTLRAMSKSSGSSSANHWKLLHRAERRRIRKATAAQKRLEFEEQQSNLRRAADLGSFEDIPLSAACYGESDDELAEEVEIDGTGNHQDGDEGDDQDEHVTHNAAFLVSYRLSDMEAFFLADTIPKHLNRLGEVLHKNLVKLEGYIWCRLRLSAAGSGVKPSGFGWFQWDHQWGSAIQEGKVSAAERNALQLVHRQISCQKLADNDESDEDDDVIEEMVCRSGQEMVYARRSTTRDLFYWSECPVLRTGAPSATSTLADFPEKARKHLKRLIM